MVGFSTPSSIERVSVDDVIAAVDAERFSGDQFFRSVHREKGDATPISSMATNAELAVKFTC
jgi:hypothetical protein